MNTCQRVVLFIGMCVAILTTTGCSAFQPSDPNTNTGNASVAERPEFTAQVPDGYDAWKDMSSGETLAEMTALAPVFGLDGIDIPVRAFYDEGMDGVAQLEKYCVLGFSDATVDAEQPLLTMTLMSRYNGSYYLFMPSLPPKNVPKMIDKYRGVCEGTEEFPVELVEQGSSA